MNMLRFDVITGGIFHKMMQAEKKCCCCKLRRGERMVMEEDEFRLLWETGEYKKDK